ncbi:hypothetical protein OH77DRAFT_120895 [Trametes cingulata]|nr:hypothetical protein OH77DRAFT_120895 [Trametes cingulata]
MRPIPTSGKRTYPLEVFTPRGAGSRGCIRAVEFSIGPWTAVRDCPGGITPLSPPNTELAAVLSTAGYCVIGEQRVRNSPRTTSAQRKHSLSENITMSARTCLQQGPADDDLMTPRREYLLYSGGGGDLRGLQRVSGGAPQIPLLLNSERRADVSI